MHCATGIEKGPQVRLASSKLEMDNFTLDKINDKLRVSNLWAAINCSDLFKSEKNIPF
jgi:hypothetical protein